MEDELINVDGMSPPPPDGAATAASRLKLAVNGTRFNSPSERTTRSAAAAAAAAQRPPKRPPKVKLKLGGAKTTGNGNTSFLGPYDRELDSDDEDELAFEEQFILRMPPGEDCEKLRTMATSRSVKSDVWFRMKDQRRGTFHIGDTTYSTKLVDLPCIIESQKTLDNRQMFKVADISQMLVVEEPIKPGDSSAFDTPVQDENFIWPHGITPPLKWARQRRFRKRVNKATIETVEQELERLLAEDELADETDWKILDNVNPDLSDSEFEDERLHSAGSVEPEDAGIGSERDGSSPIPGAPDDEGSDEDLFEAKEETQDNDDLFDVDLAAELGRAMAEDSSEDAEGESDVPPRPDEEEETDSEEDEDEDEELVEARKLLNEEINDLEAAVAKKAADIAGAVNPLIKRRFEDALKKLRADLEGKLLQREQLTERKRAEMEEKKRMVDEALEGGGQHPTDDGEDEDEEDDDEDEEEDGEGDGEDAVPAANGAKV